MCRITSILASLTTDKQTHLLYNIIKYITKIHHVIMMLLLFNDEFKNGR